MFVFYFGIVADITPPVALASFAAAGIAKASPLKTGAESTRLSIAAFIIPYMFIFSPQMLLIDTNVWEAIGILITSLVGMIGVSVGLIGYWMRPMKVWERITAGAAGLLLIDPGWVTDLIGFGLLAVLFGLQYKAMGIGRLRARNGQRL